MLPSGPTVSQVGLAAAVYSEYSVIVPCGSGKVTVATVVPDAFAACITSVTAEGVVDTVAVTLSLTYVAIAVPMLAHPTLYACALSVSDPSGSPVGVKVVVLPATTLNATFTVVAPTALMLMHLTEDG